MSQPARVPSLLRPPPRDLAARIQESRLVDAKFVCEAAHCGMDKLASMIALGEWPKPDRNHGTTRLWKLGTVADALEKL